MNTLYINGCAAYLPDNCVSVAKAVANGWYDSDDAVADGYQQARVEPKHWPVDMGIMAARDTLNQARLSADQISLLTYSSIHRHGHKHLWQPAAYIQHKLQAEQAMAMSIQHGCNALMLSFGLAMDHCQLNEERRALLISSDRFEHSYFDRWKSDYGLIYGDAAVAIALSTDIGPFEVLYYDQRSVSSLESMHRISEPEPEPESEDTLSRSHDVREAKKAYLTENGKEGFEQAPSQGLRSLRSQLLEKTELRYHMADWLILPNVGKRVLESVYEPAFADLALGDFWQAGKHIGYAGASDQFLGLALLARTGDLKPGHLILLVGVGAGFSCSILLLRVTDYGFASAQ